MCSNDIPGWFSDGLEDAAETDFAGRPTAARIAATSSAVRFRCSSVSETAGPDSILAVVTSAVDTIELKTGGRLVVVFDVVTGVVAVVLTVVFAVVGLFVVVVLFGV